MKYLLTAAAVLTLPLIAHAAWQGNTPCSKGKGGIDYCQGKKFICKDGTESASTRECDPKAYGTEPKGKKQ